MFLSQTTADTASWSVTGKKQTQKNTVSQTASVASHLPSLTNFTLHTASPTSAILLYHTEIRAEVKAKKQTGNEWQCWLKTNSLNHCSVLSSAFPASNISLISSFFKAMQENSSSSQRTQSWAFHGSQCYQCSGTQILLFDHHSLPLLSLFFKS